MRMSVVGVALVAASMSVGVSRADEACMKSCAASRSGQALVCAMPSGSNVQLRKSGGSVEMAGLSGMEPVGQVTAMRPGTRVTLLKDGKASLAGAGCNVQLQGAAVLDVSATGSCTCVTQSLGQQLGVGDNDETDTTGMVMGGVIVAAAATAIIVGATTGNDDDDDAPVSP